MKSEAPNLHDLVALWAQEDGSGYHLRSPSVRPGEWHISPHETWQYLCAGLDGHRLGIVYDDHVELNTADATSLRPEDPEFFGKLKRALKAASPMHR